MDQSELLEQLERSPLADVDSALNDLIRAAGQPSHAQDETKVYALCAALLTSQGILEDSWQGNPLEEVLRKDLTIQMRQLIAAALLRLLPRHPDLFRQGAAFAGAYSMFDDVIPEVRRHADINDRDPEYVKRQKWEGVVPALEQEWEEILTSAESVNSSETLRTLRQQFMRLLNGKTSKAVVSDFLPTHLASVRLTELFAATDEYLSAEDANVVPTYRQIEHILDQFRVDAENWGTTYSQRYLAGFANLLEKALVRHFHESPASRSANLLAKGLEKKYPLRSEGPSFDFAFVIKNEGPGYALDVRVSVEIVGVQIDKPDQYVGNLGLDPAEILVQFAAHIDGQTGKVMSETVAEVHLTWINLDGSPGQYEEMWELHAQRGNVDWDGLSHADPFDLEPVTTKDDFVGRATTINQLLGLAHGKRMGSAWLWGQKRVGKTSIVKTLASLLRTENSDYRVVYLETGDFIHQDPSITITKLGERICREILSSDNRLKHLRPPNFDGSLAPFSDFADTLVQTLPQLRVVIILDEFDELTSDLSRPGSVADALFLPLRSISSKEFLGFILVGGEKMAHINSRQGERLNKFKQFEVDYFDRQKHWADFQDLVRRPVGKWLEVSDAALNVLYEQTAGNPYFTKLICSEMFKMAVVRRDSHITAKEVMEAVHIALESTGSQSFQHFWKDGIVEAGERVEEIIASRQKVLLAIARVLHEHQNPTEDSIMERAKAYGLTELKAQRVLHEDLERRKIVQLVQGTYCCRVPFFQKWLTETGVRELVTSFYETDSAFENEKAEADAYVRSEEIRKLVLSWGTYKQRSVTEDHIRAWLAQFGDNRDQRLMFQILQGIKYCTGDYIRRKLREADSLLGRRGIARRLERGRKKRRDILISYLEESPAKSGAHYAQLYADENEISTENVVDPSKLVKALQTKTDLQAIVFVDDFVGTGESASKCFTRLNKECGSALREAEIPIFLFAICGFVVGKEKIERTIAKLRLDVEVHLCDPLDASARCFGSNSTVFADARQRSRTHELALQFGSVLQRAAPLGFGDSQALVVFEQSCPNNTLPILWSESKDGQWTPLFRR